MYKALENESVDDDDDDDGCSTEIKSCISSNTKSRPVVALRPWILLAIVLSSTGMMKSCCSCCILYQDFYSLKTKLFPHLRKK